MRMTNLQTRGCIVAVLMTVAATPAAPFVATTIAITGAVLSIGQGIFSRKASGASARAASLRHQALMTTLEGLRFDLSAIQQHLAVIDATLVNVPRNTVDLARYEQARERLAAAFEMRANVSATYAIGVDPPELLRNQDFAEVSNLINLIWSDIEAFTDPIRRLDSRSIALVVTLQEALAALRHAQILILTRDEQLRTLIDDAFESQEITGCAEGLNSFLVESEMELFCDGEPIYEAVDGADVITERLTRNMQDLTDHWAGIISDMATNPTSRFFRDVVQRGHQGDKLFLVSNDLRILEANRLSDTIEHDACLVVFDIIEMENTGHITVRTGRTTSETFQTSREVVLGATAIDFEGPVLYNAGGLNSIGEVSESNRSSVYNELGSDPFRTVAGVERTYFWQFPENLDATYVDAFDYRALATTFGEGLTCARDASITLYAVQRIDTIDCDRWCGGEEWPTATDRAQALRDWIAYNEFRDVHDLEDRYRIPTAPTDVTVQYREALDLSPAERSYPTMRMRRLRAMFADTIEAEDVTAQHLKAIDGAMLVASLFAVREAMARSSAYVDSAGH